mgnify:CR=1 FL=1
MPPLPTEIFSRSRRIQLRSRRAVSNVFAGAYHSVFKGHGIEFDDVREYQPGDDIRSIDWNVKARTGIPHIKKFHEERELTVMLLVDASNSCRIGSTGMLNSQLAGSISRFLG